MRLERVPGPDHPDFAALWEIYESSFPPDERRTLAQQSGLFSDPRYSLLAALQGASPCGLISSWELADLHFIEHMAVHEGGRGKGAGTSMLRSFLQGRAKAVLEVERPEDTAKARRIRFYERAGFHLNPYAYIQPAYGPGKKPVSLLLMSFPEALGEAGFAETRSLLHRLIYGLPGPLI